MDLLDGIFDFSELAYSTNDVDYLNEDRPAVYLQLFDLNLNSRQSSTFKLNPNVTIKWRMLV